MNLTSAGQRLDPGRASGVVLVAAPMEGVIDPILRAILTGVGGLDWCVSEFIRVTDRLLPVAEFYKLCPELLNGAQTAYGTPVQVQLLGGQPEPLAENALRAVELGAPAIDLNFGCPARTVNRHDGGAVLLQTPARLERIVLAVRRALPPEIPVSAKVRLGFTDKTKFVDIGRAVQAGGASWLTVHARTKVEGYQAPAHWHYIGELRRRLTIPVIANGEIWSPSDWQHCQRQTGCSAFMLGRGLVARPDLALLIRALSKSPQADRGAAVSLSERDLLVLIQNLLTDSQAQRGESYGLARAKQWVKLMARSSGYFLSLFERIKLLQEIEAMAAEIAKEMTREMASNKAGENSPASVESNAPSTLQSELRSNPKETHDARPSSGVHEGSLPLL